MKKLALSIALLFLINPFSIRCFLYEMTRKSGISVEEFLEFKQQGTLDQVINDAENAFNVSSEYWPLVIKLRKHLDPENYTDVLERVVIDAVKKRELMYLLKSKLEYPTIEDTAGFEDAFKTCMEKTQQIEQQEQDCKEFAHKLVKHVINVTYLHDKIFKKMEQLAADEGITKETIDAKYKMPEKETIEEVANK